MTYFLFIIKTAFEDFNRNKIRTFLTSLGILIGVSSVVLLISLGLGLKAYIQQQFESMGTNLVFIMPGSMSGAGMGGMMSAIRFDNKDLQTLKRIRNVSAILPFVVKYSKLQSNTDSATYELAGSTAEALDVMDIEIEYGRPYTKSDVEKGAKVVVLGSKTAEKLFGSGANAAGKTVKLEGQGFKVIGIAKSKGGGGLGMPSVDEHVYMPHSAMISFNPDKKFYAIYLQAESEDAIPEIISETKKLLAKRYTNEDDFSVIEQTEILNTVNSIFAILNLVLVAIAAISLIVGGVGIMNIMFVSVIERIREIGIRRAIGAKKADILWQFLAEAVLLSGIGGAMGLLISFVVVLALSTQFPAYIDLTTVLIALGVSSGVGIVFGVFPAKQAADLSPIEAIRYE